jgi:hypothetical protein
MEYEMHFDLTSHESIYAALVLALIILFALAAFFDYRWKKAAPHRSFSFNQNNTIPAEPDITDNKESMSNLYLSHADLSALGLGTAEQQITVRGKTQQDHEDDQCETQALILGDLGDPALNSHVRCDRSSGIPL